MLVLAAFLLAAAAIVAIGSITLVNRTHNDVIEAQSVTFANQFLDAREEAIAYVQRTWTPDPNATLGKRLQTHLNSLFADPLGATLQIRVELAGNTSLAGRVEHDGSDADLVDEAGEYLDPVCEVLSCATPLLYDGAGDGFVHDADGTTLAALVWLEVSADRGFINELLVVPAP